MNSYHDIKSVSTVLGLPCAWLKQQADAGRVPFIEANNRRLFNPNEVQRVLDERANATVEVDEVER